MLMQKGIPVMTGIAVSEAVVLRDSGRQRIGRHHVDRSECAAEMARIRAAIAQAAQDLDGEIHRLEAHAGVGARILQFHKVLVQSPDILRDIEDHIHTRNMSAEYALSCVMQRWHAHFAQMQSETAAQKIHDLRDVEHKILNHLSGGAPPCAPLAFAHEVVVVAHNLTPSQTAALDRTKVKGFATDVGGKTSHTAIMARALAIPAVVGTGDLSRRLQGGETVIIDGLRGLVIVDPDAETLAQYQAQERRHRKAFSALVAERDLPAETLDGYEVAILANIELAEEVDMAVQMGADGIGLYRTEFLYEDHREPDEDLQLSVYQDVLGALQGRACVIRTMDLGADKLAPVDPDGGERNPFLGSRSIRYSLQHPAMFAMQLRAILRASAHGDVRIMFPMISSMEELREAKALLGKAAAGLAAEGIAFREPIPTGMMVEVPSAAIAADQFAAEVDFFSIGTNDLVQYALAVDRVNSRVAHLYQPGAPAILRLLKQIIATADRRRVDICVCGEMSADPRFAILLLGLGLRAYSVAPVAVPLIKHIVRSIALADAEAIAEKALSFSTACECNAFLQDRIGSLLPSIM